MASPNGLVDLRSDTVTSPTPEMRRAMADAEVGDDVYGEDPTVNRLQSLAAGLLGKEAALYVPSGVMANQLAIRVLAGPGTELACPARAHVYCYESAAAARNSGVQVRPLDDDGGVVAVDDLASAFEADSHHLPRLSLLSLENTHMAASGRPLVASEVEALAQVAHARNVPVYVDGARIWNAAIALGASPADLCAAADAVMFCVSKGLSAPVGSLLCGTLDVVDEAREERHRLGGAMRQSGVLAAAGIVALETMVERLADDHARARTVADALAARWPGSVDPNDVRTNIVCAHAATLPKAFIERLAAHGVAAGTIDPQTVRLVTHKDVDDADLDRVVAAFDAIAETA